MHGGQNLSVTAVVTNIKQFDIWSCTAVTGEFGPMLCM